MPKSFLRACLFITSTGITWDLHPPLNTDVAQVEEECLQALLTRKQAHVRMYVDFREGGRRRDR